MGPPSSTPALLESIRGGDSDSPSKLFEKQRRRLTVLVHYKLSPEVRSRIEVDDIVQEICLRAFRDLDRFAYRSPGSFFRWLSSIADHVIADQARYLGRQRRAAEAVPFRSDSNPLGPEPADTKTPSRLFSQQEAVDRLIARFDELPPDYRQVLVMAKIEGLTTAEMAERLGKSREAIALLVYRAVKRFRAVCESSETDG